MARKWWILTSVACGTFMATLDSSIVNIALPSLTRDLASDLDHVKWVVILYLLVITCLLLPFGRLSDQLGRKRVFQGGYLIFTVGSLLCGFAPNLGLLVAARALQGVGASMLMANGPAIITAAFTSNDRGGALGTMSMVVSAGLISGPSVGGFLISALGWRSIFFLNVPIGILAMFLVHRFLYKDEMDGKPLPFDWMGAILQCVILLSFIVVFDPTTLEFTGIVETNALRAILAVVTLLLLIVFVRIEGKVSAPLFDLSLLKVRTFWSSNLASLLTFVSFSTVTILMPFFLEQEMHLPPHGAGVIMTAIPITILIVAPLSGRLSDRFGGRGLTVAGSLVGAVSLLGMAGVFSDGLQADTSNTVAALALAAIGLAIGLFQSPNNNSIMGAVPLNKIGVASAFLATIRNLGLVIGTALATGIFTWKMDLTHGDFVDSLHFTHLVAAGIAGLAALACFGKKEA